MLAECEGSSAATEEEEADALGSQEMQ